MPGRRPNRCQPIPKQILITKSSIENRGKGEFVRISWDEALDILISELKRIKETYGNSAIFTIASGHGNMAHLSSHGLMRRVLNLWGGNTPMIRNPDSWEGWFWGAEHAWGFDETCGTGSLYDLLEDTMQHSELSVFWSYDPETSSWMSGQDSSQWLLWLKELGKKMIFITPDLSFTAATKADKWIPFRPGTDAALASAIAYVRITEGRRGDESQLYGLQTSLQSGSSYLRSCEIDDRRCPPSGGTLRGQRILRGGGSVAVAPAIANAFFGAVGVRIRDLPITKEKVLKILRSMTGKEVDMK